ncbi:MAG TPA: hypothetical protein VJ723_05515, partial [Candidatus Angelobacter sp.]|nr:hypothetical protein [Candidatus Angelobacter sp.]
MTKSRKLLILVLIVAALAAATLLITRQMTRPPEAARLLPEGDTLIYANLRPIHALGPNKPAQLEESYKDFMQQTGIEPERDLDEVAFSRQNTSDGRDVESSEVFVGRFDRGRTSNYFQKIAGGKEQYLDKTIFSMPHEGHTVRVCILSDNMIAVTNMESNGAMHRIIDRMGTSGGPSLLETHYRQVPTASVAWIITRVPAKPNGLELPGGMSFSFHQEAVVVASLRYAGAVLFRADFLTQSEDDARQLSDSLHTFLAISRTVGQTLASKAVDQDVRAAFNSV